MFCRALRTRRCGCGMYTPDNVTEYSRDIQVLCGVVVYRQKMGGEDGPCRDPETKPRASLILSRESVLVSSKVTMGPCIPAIGVLVESWLLLAQPTRLCECGSQRLEPVRKCSKGIQRRYVAVRGHAQGTVHGIYVCVYIYIYIYIYTVGSRKCVS